MKKNAFSLAEILITMIMTGVLISMVALSVKQVARYDKLAKPAYNILQEMVSDAVDPNTKTIDTAAFCTNITKNVNVVGGANCPAYTIPDPNYHFNLPNKMSVYSNMSGATWTAFDTIVKIDLNGEENGPNIDYRDIVYFTVWTDGSVQPDAQTQRMIRCKVFVNNMKTDAATVTAVRNVLVTFPGWTAARAQTFTDGFTNNATTKLENDIPVFYGTFNLTSANAAQLRAAGADATNECN